MLGKIPIEVEFQPVTMVKIRILGPNGNVKITAPDGMSEENILMSAYSKNVWIRKCIDIIQNRARFSGIESYIRTIYIWGKLYTTEVVKIKGKSEIIIDGGILRMYICPGTEIEARQKFFDKWCCNTVKEAASVLIKKYEPLMETKVEELCVRQMYTLWGRCSRKKRGISLNSNLVKHSPECLEFVIVHEMVHLIQKGRGHKLNFQRLMDKYLPVWRTREWELEYEVDKGLSV